jgi:hypothetical protein
LFGIGSITIGRASYAPGWRWSLHVEVAFDLISAAGAPKLGSGDYGVTAGSAANLFTVAASCIAEAVTAHPPRKLVLYDGKIVARDGSFLTAPIPIASKASA